MAPKKRREKSLQEMIKELGDLYERVKTAAAEEMIKNGRKNKYGMDLVEKYEKAIPGLRGLAEEIATQRQTQQFAPLNAMNEFFEAFLAKQNDDLGKLQEEFSEERQRNIDLEGDFVAREALIGLRRKQIKQLRAEVTDLNNKNKAMENAVDAMKDKQIGLVQQKLEIDAELEKVRKVIREKQNLLKKRKEEIAQLEEAIKENLSKKSVISGLNPLLDQRIREADARLKGLLEAVVGVLDLNLERDTLEATPLAGSFNKSIDESLGVVEKLTKAVGGDNDFYSADASGLLRSAMVYQTNIDSELEKVKSNIVSLQKVIFRMKNLIEKANGKTQDLSKETKAKPPKLVKSSELSNNDKSPRTSPRNSVKKEKTRGKNFGDKPPGRG